MFVCCINTLLHRVDKRLNGAGTTRFVHCIAASFISLCCILNSLDFRELKPVENVFHTQFYRPPDGLCRLYVDVLSVDQVVRC